jgi:uncharacterized protein YcfJ
MNAVLGVVAIVFATHAAAQIVLYEHEGFRGRVFSSSRPIWNFERLGFNDRASSVIVEHGRWEVCEDARFEGRCIVLRPGSYDSLSRIGMNNRISSARPISRNVRYQSESPEPVAAPSYEYRQRPGERLYEVPLSSVRAVVGPPEHRCWVERQQVVEDRGGANVPGAIVGGIVGGVLGHQIGSGRGRDVATVGGAVAGAAVGANVGRSGTGTYERDVRRCETVPSQGRPDYWDVTYEFRGKTHHAQLSSLPGRTITVNGNGEPRG